ncbi:WhiB family transcriptional regulator [Streptomyces tsukubensis]|uniref:WhiB family transcriptional regulator n=1 Tax=Streptomyces tsukubensis TaxID=83656 RepID=UPI0036C096E9
MNHSIVRKTPYYGAVSTEAPPAGPHALCAGEDPELFFPIGNTGPALLQIEEAKAVCNRGCPLMERCLQDALDRGEQGVWGGTDEDDRRRMKRRAARRAA